MTAPARTGRCRSRAGAAYPGPIRVTVDDAREHLPRFVRAGELNASPRLSRHLRPGFNARRLAGLGHFGLAYLRLWDVVADGLATSRMVSHRVRSGRPAADGLRAVLRGLSDALRFRLTHRLGHYNAVQSACFAAVIGNPTHAELNELPICEAGPIGWLTRRFGGDRRHASSILPRCVV